MSTTLNPQQQLAVKYINGPLLVLAGAGSGKTSVITQKIRWLISDCGYQPRQITAVTFTNKAAREMRERVSKLLGAGNTKGIRICTFHTLGLDIIKSELKTAGLRSGFSIFDSEDARRILKDVAFKDSDLSTDLLDLAQHQISTWKNELIEPERAVSLAETDGELRLALLYGRYCEALTAYNAVDFDDLIRLPVKLFQQHARILERWRNRIHYMLVDEYQDTNLSQYALVKMIVADRQQLTVVGDDDQSIYAWRGARPENLAKLQEDFPHLEIVKLEQNYRSSSRILRCANHVIANNPHVFEKALWSSYGDGEMVRLTRLKNEDDELDWVVKDIEYRIAARKQKYKDIAILYRGNHQAKLLELKLQSRSIPYQLSGGTSFFARTEIKDVMAYLRVLVNPEDDNAFLRIVNTPRRQIGTQTVQQLSDYASHRGVGLLAACGEFGLTETAIKGAALERLQRLSHWFADMAKRADGAEGETIRQMLTDIDYLDWLHQNASAPKVAEGRFANILTLVKNIEGMIERHQDEDNPLESSINKLILMDMLDEQSEEANEDQVQLLTLHASKGLEYPLVYLIGVEDGILPHQNSIDSDTVEEERRLFYVGITRAKQELSMTMAAMRKQFGETRATIPSRFIDELPQNDLLIRGMGSDKQSESQKKQVTDTARANLRALFD